MRTLSATGLLVFGCLIYSVCHADIEGQTATDRQVTLAVTSLMRSEHLTRHPLDGEIATRCITLYLKTLDPWKLYFFQSDADNFMARTDELIHQVRRGDVALGHDVFRTFLKRVDERVKYADEFLAAKLDFDADEGMVSDPEAAKYARTPDEARDLWRKRVKYDLLVLKADKTEGDEASKKLSRRYHSFVKRMHQTDHDELLEMYLTSLTTSYDPHSTYMSPSTLDNFEIQMKLELDGIGAQLQFEDGFTMVNKIIPGGAADKDKRLKAEDKITGVAQGKDGEMVDVVDMKLSDVVKLIRGKRGTIVRLEVLPLGKGEKQVYEITRAQIELTDSEARGQIFEEKRGGQTIKVGVIDLPSFYMDMEGARHNRPDFRSTTRDVGKLLDEFNDKNVDALILDLRRNGGGSLTEAINLTGLFIDEGPIVQVKDKDGKKQVYNDLDRGVKWDRPLVVLTSKFSASASEIFAGAIQDYRRGLIVGDRSTHGKGTVQSLLDLGRQLFQIPNAPSLGALKLTMQQFYRPDGDSTQNRGVRADVPLPSLTAELDVGEADLEYALPFDRIDAVPYDKVNMVDQGKIDRLTELTKERQKTSTDFDKVLRNIKRYHEQKARKTVTLNEKKFLAERAELDMDKEQEKDRDEQNDPHRPIFERNFYGNEVISITLDFLQQSKLAAR
ncbi:MAG TPA: carboxy terminal-processing peptidase [Pirellulales bacterium]|jgi:carboxyl-terminal processing protease|nr:carboxy terminal-processing peptidase [Pirellulales bacterium]